MHTGWIFSNIATMKAKLILDTGGTMKLTPGVNLTKHISLQVHCLWGSIFS